MAIHEWSQLAEFPLSQRNWEKLRWEGHLVDEASEHVDPKFIYRFLQSREDVQGKLSSRYEVLDDGWLRYPLRATHKRQAGWATTFHGSHWYTLYSVLTHGLLESKTNVKTHRKSKTKCQGVYSFIEKEHCCAYCMWIIMPDGVFWALMYELLVSMDHHMHQAPGAKQQCSAKEATEIVAVHARALTQEDCRKLVHDQPKLFSTFGQWQPQLECNPDTLDDEQW